MICPNCGHENAEDAPFCSNCGTSLETTKRGVTEVFSRMTTVAFTRPGLKFVAWLVGIYVGIYVLLGLATAATVYAGVGTLRFHKIVNTSCFVKSGPSDGFMFGSGSGSGTTMDYKLRPHCNWLPLTVNWAAVAVVAAIVVVVLALIGATAYIIVVRMADRLGEGAPRRLEPTMPEVLRALGRLIGWSILVYVGVALAVGIVVGVVALCAAALPGPLAGLLGVAVGIAAIYAFIRYLVPWYMRALLLVMIMLADDRPVRPIWSEMKMRALTAWKLVGIFIVIGIVTGVAGQISSTLFTQGTAVTAIFGGILYIVVVAVQIGVQALFLMMAARQTQRGWKT